MPKKRENHSSDKIRSSFGNKKGGKDNRRKTKEQRKKGQAKLKNVMAEIDQLETRIKLETPPAGTLYYKYKPELEKGSNEEEKVVQKTKSTILETADKTKVKIRFSDLPISRCTTSGLFKSKFIKMTEV